MVASVLSAGTGKYLEKTSRNLNRKLQLSLAPEHTNRGISVDKVTIGMLLQGTIASKESKGYMVDLGLKDGARGFVKADDVPSDGTKLYEGSLVHVAVQSVTSKLIKCTLVSQAATAEPAK